MLAVNQGGVPARPRVAGGWRSRESGVQDPDLNNRLVDTAGYVCLRPSHFQAIPLSAVANMQVMQRGCPEPLFTSGQLGSEGAPIGPPSSGTRGGRSESGR